MNSDGLADLDADDYRKKPKRKSARKTSKDTGYRIKNALKVPRATTYTAQALYDQPFIPFNRLTDCDGKSDA